MILVVLGSAGQESLPLMLCSTELRLKVDPAMRKHHIIAELIEATMNHDVIKASPAAECAKAATKFLKDMMTRISPMLAEDPQIVDDNDEHETHFTSSEHVKVEQADGDDGTSSSGVPLTLAAEPCIEADHPAAGMSRFDPMA